MVDNEFVDKTALRALNSKVVRSYSMYFVGLGAAAAVGGALVALADPKIALPALFILVGAATIALGMFVGRHSAIVRPFAGHARAFWSVLALVLLATVVAIVAWPGHQWLGWITAALALGDGLAVGHLVNRAGEAQE